MKPSSLMFSLTLSLVASPALAWGDICKNSENKFHKEYSIMNMCRRDGGCSANLHAMEAKKAIQEGRDAACSWAFK